MKRHESDRLDADRNLDRGLDTVRRVTSKRAVLNQALLGVAAQPRRLQVLTVTGWSSPPSGFVLFVVDCGPGIRFAPNRAGAASTRRSGLRSHASQLRGRDRYASGGQSVNPLANMLNGQCARNSLHTRCAEFKISLTQDLQFSDFFVATSCAAGRKKIWKIFCVVH